MPPPGVVPGRRPFQPRSLWLGWVIVDPYGLWEPGSFDQAFAAPSTDDQAPSGGLQLDVEPRRAQVYMDQFYVGIVDQFSGYYQHLDVPAGLHHFEFVASDYDPLIVDIMVSPGRTTTYRAWLNRR